MKSFLSLVILASFFSLSFEEPISLKNIQSNEYYCCPCNKNRKKRERTSREKTPQEQLAEEITRRG